MVSSTLAGGDTVRIGGIDRSCVDGAALTQGSRFMLAPWDLDVPVPFHGADLFPSCCSGHYPAIGILVSGGPPDLGRRYFGLHLVRVESYQLVSRARYDRGRFIFDGSTV